MGQPLHSADWAPSMLQVPCKHWSSTTTLSTRRRCTLRFNGTAFDGLLHRHQGVLILELEIHVENFQPRQ